jgi:hypothetical protein
VVSGDNTVLLGADLENVPDPNVGWKAVVTSSARPNGLAQLIKVPHHGSEGAHLDEVWTSMLEPEPRAVLSPYTRSGLPLDRDLERLRGHAGSVYCTAPAFGARSRRSRTVEKMSSLATTELRLARRKMGHVRFRGPMNPGGGFSVETFGSAYRA